MKSRFNRRKCSTEQTFPEMNLTPLIDTAWTLLVILMVSAPSIRNHNALKVELPRGQVNEVESMQQQDIVVEINSAGKYSLNGSIMTQAQLIEKLHKLVQAKSEITVFVNADGRISYSTVVELVDRIKQVQGVRYVALATTQTA